MSAKTTNDEPTTGYVQHESLAAALAAFQAALPAVHKGAKGQVPGKRDHRYADLADLSGTVLPLLGRHGLSWITMPTFEDGRFVLRYELLHTSGESRVGFYPLPSDSDAWKMGSALTYGRRYLLSAVTGVAADEDDDGAAAAGVPHDGGRQASRSAPQNGHQAAPADPPASAADRARDDLRAAIKTNGWDGKAVAAEFSKRYDGADLRTEDNAPRIVAFTKLLPDVFAPASNGAVQ